MMKELNKHIVFGAIALLIITNLKTCFDKGAFDKTFVKTTVSEKVLEKKDSVQKDSLQHKKIVVVYDTIRKVVIRHVKKPNQVNQVQKKAFKVIDTTRLKNARVFSEITSEGKVLDYKVKVETKERIVTKITTKEVIRNKVPNSLFLSVSSLFSANSIDGVELSIDYTFKNKFRIGAGGGYFNSIPYGKITIGIPID
ncbi:conserved hypothetical protein [Tenacibaculum maritimum]|uniref:hypothetical protein n=1 Tax=Tenacibaculum maritimum TaxID=107401 RepID=UPI0012E487E1|nr:hypothetical protein [Tenacibaculum maritimum]CAA0185448.1 conserved hypothetical protein [Tenacibaculum maritimum]